MKFISRPVARRILPITAAAVLAACGGGSDGDSIVAPSIGTLRIALTDIPACGYDEVNVTVEKVRVHQNGAANDNASGWSEVLLSTPKRINLLNLTNGVLEELGSTQLPAGTYTQLRLVLSDNTPSAPLANSVIPTGLTETPLGTPSAQQSGLKINSNVTVGANQLTDVVLDLDACKSVVVAGNSGGYNLKPVLTILPRSSTGLAVEGYVANAIASGATSVSLQNDAVVARATVPDTNGKFVLSPVPAGTYDLVITSSGRVTSVVTGVPVTATGKTILNASTTPIDPAVSTMRKASGNVTTTGASNIPDGTVRVLQAIGTPKIEVIARSVNADTGAYSFNLPTAAPVKTAYVAGATALTFTPDGAAAAKYILEARVAGKPTQTANIDLAVADVVTSFAFAP